MNTGIPYLTPDDEAKLRADLDRKHEEATKTLADGDSNHNSNSAKKGLVTIPEDQKKFLSNVWYVGISFFFIKLLPY